MADKQPPLRIVESYWDQTRRPVYSAILVLPLVFIYQVGVWVFQPQVINGGDAVIRRLLGFFPRIAAFVSLIVLLVYFVVWQWRTRASHKTDSGKIVWTFVESMVLGELLFHLLGWLSVNLPAAGLAPAAAHSGRGVRGHLIELVLYCGAGVYEELVFRVLLTGLLILICTKLLQMQKLQAAVWSVALGSLLFALFHYIGPGGDPWSLNGFVQRAFAGVYFAAIYVSRSFGVAAAAHAYYDVRVGLYFMLSGP